MKPSFLLTLTSNQMVMVQTIAGVTGKSHSEVLDTVLKDAMVALITHDDFVASVAEANAILHNAGNWHE
jgi:arginine repressor